MFHAAHLLSELEVFVKIFQRKSRLVSFRVSEKEYESLRRTAAVHGVRGISDVARFAVRKVLAVSMPDQDRWMNEDWTVEESVARLTQNLEQIANRMDQIVQRLDLLKYTPEHQQITTDAGVASLEAPRAMSASGR